MTNADRFYIQFHHQLSAMMPRPAGIHIYSTGRLYRNMRTYLQGGKWNIELSKNVPYASFVFGYREDMSRRVPRGALERINFQTLKICALSVARNIAIPTGGKVVCLLG